MYVIFAFHISVGILVMLYGCVVGWSTNGIVKLRQEDSPIPLTKAEGTLLPAFFELGRFSSAIPAGISSDFVGRKPIIYLCGVQHLLAWLIKIFTSSKHLLYTARFLSGVATGTGNAVLFIYAGEVSPPRIRGTVLSVLYTCYYLGILVQFVLGAYLDYRLVCVVSLAISLTFFVFVAYIKESPSFLMTKRKYDEAKRIHQWLNAGTCATTKADDELCKEFEATKEYVSNQQKSKESVGGGFADPVNRRCVSLVFFINFLTQLTGLPAVTVFVYSVFENVKTFSPATFAVTFAAFQYAAGCFSSVLSDKIGRRRMYMLTCSLCALSHLFTAVLFLLNDELGVAVPCQSWLLLLSVTFYACVYAAGLGPLTVIVRGELLPQAVKGVGSGLAVVSAGVSCFLLIFIFHLMDEYVGMAYNFLFFLFCTVSLAVLVHFTLPETKHKTLAEIQAAMRPS